MIPPLRHSRTSALLALLLLATPGLPARADQDSNVFHPIKVIEQRLAGDSIRILDWRGSRKESDRTQRVTLAYPDSSVMIVKWAQFALNGEAFNNNPRHEMAAYAIQKLFLDEADYVVPVTITRAFDLDWYRNIVTDAKPTFDKGTSVLVLLQYWLAAVTPDSAFNLNRFATDTIYARHLGDLNLLTHIIKHNDSNVGNVLVSTNPVNPRLFAVDNGLSFDNEESSRGALWRELRVPAVPARTIDRLRGITRADLDRVLGVLAEYEVRDGKLIVVPPSENIARMRGVRRRDNRIQFGLTATEIVGVEDRLKSLVRRVDAGRLKTF